MGIRYVLTILAAICFVVGLYLEFARPRWARRGPGMAEGWLILFGVFAWFAILAFILFEHSVRP